MGKICPRSDPDIAHMRYYLGPLKLNLISQCTTGYEIWDNFNFPMLNPHWQLCKYGPHLWPDLAKFFLQMHHLTMIHSPYEVYIFERL